MYQIILIMNDIYKIYHNEIGISFQWKKDIQNGFTDSIQLVFRNTGFYLNYDEIKEFYNNVNIASRLKACGSCRLNEQCHRYLLQTPSEKVDLAVNKSELELIEDLIKGTLFQIELDNYINDVCRN